MKTSKNIEVTNEDNMDLINKLTVPRFEVIAEFPKCKFLKGDLLQRVINAANDWYHTDVYSCLGGYDISDLEKYPHLFKKLNWWDNRKEKEMPKYLKQNYDLENPNWTFHKIYKWDMKRKIGFLDSENYECCDLMIWRKQFAYLPATKEEYERHNN